MNELLTRNTFDDYGNEHEDHVTHGTVLAQERCIKLSYVKSRLSTYQVMNQCHEPVKHNKVQKLRKWCCPLI